ncbi:MAG: ethanolamine ammonia-lyase subunit EutC [Oscillospiraceae bacterium]|nr:ethanolamine ammonia-lyase subunit EutC [Oscillospiraceae bacterium]
MNKQELTAMVAEILGQMGLPEPMVKGSDYKPANPGPEQKENGFREGDFVPDVTALDLRKLYLQENAADKEGFARLKAKTPARLGSGRAGPRYKTLTMLRFRADHAAAQDAVFSQVSEDFGSKNDLIPLKTRCKDKEEYLTRPDLGRILDEESEKKLKSAVSAAPRVQIVVGDGLSSAAIQANAMDCMAAIRDGLKARGIDTGKAVFVRYCRVGAGDAVGDVTGCELVCVLVGERPGLVTDKSMSAYITYKPHTGVSESARTVVSNIHAQGTPAVEAGAHIAELIETILRKRVSGVGLHLEGAK